MEAHGMGTGLKDYGHKLAERSVAQMFALIAGVVLVVAGIASLIVGAEFGTGDDIVTNGLLFMDVNGWSGLLMLVTGGLLLVGSRSDKAARRDSMIVGAIYLIVTVWSLFTVSVLGVFPVNDPTAILYAAIGVLGLTAAFGSDRTHD